MSFSLSINYDGNCRDAVTFYAKVFEQEVPSFLTYAEGEVLLSSVNQIPEKMKSRVMRTCLNIAGTPVEFYDIPDTFGFFQGNNMVLNISCKDAKKAKKIFELLSENGAVDIPYTQIKDGRYYGMLEDKFHMHWMIKTELNKFEI